MIGTAAAVQLLETFGSLRALLEKPASTFTHIPGLGPKSATRLKAAAEIGRRLCLPQTEKSTRLTSPGDVANFVMAEMRYLTREELRVIVVDSRNRVIGMNTIYKGSVNSAVFRMFELFQCIQRYETATAFFVVHNHPSGDPKPSPEDIQVTREIVRAGKLMDMHLLDHLIIGDGRFYSLKERGLGFD